MKHARIVYGTAIGAALCASKHALLISCGGNQYALMNVLFGAQQISQAMKTKRTRFHTINMWTIAAVAAAAAAAAAKVVPHK